MDINSKLHERLSIFKEKLQRGKNGLNTDQRSDPVIPLCQTSTDCEELTASVCFDKSVCVRL